MKILPQQLEVLQAEAEREFAQRICQILIKDFAFIAEEHAPKELRRKVEYGISIARLRGLTWQSSITLFTLLMFLIGPRFYYYPAIHSFLSDPTEPPDERVKKLSERISPEQWEDARSIHYQADWPA